MIFWQDLQRKHGKIESCFHKSQIWCGVKLKDVVIHYCDCQKDFRMSDEDTSTTPLFPSDFNDGRAATTAHGQPCCVIVGSYLAFSSCLLLTSSSSTTPQSYLCRYHDPTNSSWNPDFQTI